MHLKEKKKEIRKPTKTGAERRKNCRGRLK